MAVERYYPQAKGSYVSEFNTAGDEFLESGRVTSWRVLLIVNGKIVALQAIVYVALMRGRDLTAVDGLASLSH